MTSNLRDYFTATTTILLLILSLIACSSSNSGSKSAVPAPKSPAEVAARLEHGIDVSDHSGTVDWDSVAAQGFTFAFVKATEGEDLKDSAFDNHWQAMKERGIIRGAYHFYVTEDEPDTMAAFFIQNVKLEPGDLAPVVDIEEVGHNTKPGLTTRFKRFLTLLEEHYGIKPIIYTTADFWDEHLKADFGDYPLWVAEYDVDTPRMPAGWKNYTLWQWQENAPIPGVEKGADISRFNKDREGLEELVVWE